MPSIERLNHFMDLYICKAIEIFLTASISVIGAFLPIFILMYIHFVLRRRAYKEKKAGLIKLKQEQETKNSVNKKALHALYASVGVDDYRGLVEQVISQPSNHWEKIGLVLEHLDRFHEGNKKLDRIIADIQYIENYNFKTYLGILLDKRFPDNVSE